MQIRFEVNGVPHLVRRSSQDGTLLIKVASDEMCPCTEEDVRALLPIQGYSQKQLSNVSVRVDELSRFITAPIRAALGHIERHAADRAERTRQSYATRRHQRRLTQTLQKRELEEKSLTGQADALRDSLTGLSDEDRALLEKGKVYESADRAVQSWQDGISSFREGAASVRSMINSYLEAAEPPPTKPEEKILAAAHEEHRNLLSDAKASLDTLIQRAAAITAPTAGMDADSPRRQWAEKMAAFKTAYDAAVQRSSAHDEKMKQLKDVDSHPSKHVRETTWVREELRGLAAAEAGYRAEREAWEALLKECDELLDAQCKTLTESSEGSIRAHVKRHADASEFVHSLRQLLGGSRIQSGKIEKLGESITSAADPSAQWSAILLDLEKLAEFDAEQDSTERRSETPVLAGSGLAAGDLDRIARNLKPEDWLSLSLTPIKSLRVFEYRAREGEYIPFLNASAGQLSLKRC